MTSKSGVIKDVHIDKKLQKYIIYQLQGTSKGTVIDKPMLHKAGILIMKFDTYKEQQEILADFSELAWIELE